MSSNQKFVFEPVSTPSLAIRGSAERFPVSRVYCIGRNYEAHAVEMGHDPTKEPPFFFQKNTSSVYVGRDFPYPPETSDVHHEIEMVAVLHKGGDKIPVDEALNCVFGYGVGLDMTRRDLQAEAKKLGRPWEVGKAFECSGPCSEIVRASEIGHPSDGEIWLKVNGETRQRGNLNQMIWKTAEQVSILSRFFTLQPGDVIFTGTPSGVGPVKRGDQMHGFIAGIGDLQISVI
jgi:fumarylpyruvate hydrolase